MRSRQYWQRLLGHGLLAASLLTGAGCLNCCHPVACPPPELLESCQGVPKCCRSHVYIFLMNGLDPTDCANLTGVCDYLHDLGYIKTYYAQVCHVSWFKDEIRRLHKEDADARFVLIGHGCGANKLRSLAQDLKCDNICVDLLVYLDSETLENEPKNRPENVGRVVNMLAGGMIWKGEQIEGAENVELRNGGHFGSATHPCTLEMLAQEIAQVAAHVPIPQPKEPVATTPDAAPIPRPVMPQISSERDEWDFLKPRASGIGHRVSGK